MLDKLYHQLKRLFPTLETSTLAQLCLLVFRDQGKAWNKLGDKKLVAIANQLRLKLEQATDQYDAVTIELKEMAESNASTFGQDQVWTLLRAIKIQDQLLKMHIGGELLNV